MDSSIDACTPASSGTGHRPEARQRDNDAYEQAKTVGGDGGPDLPTPFELRIVEIRVKGSNPITDYLVDATD